VRVALSGRVARAVHQHFTQIVCERYIHISF
jgi:hypothetical protein